MIAFFKTLAGDLLLPYRHFLHWTLTKVFVFVYSLSFALLISIPLLVLLFGIWYLDPIDWMGVGGELGYNGMQLDDALTPYIYKYWWVILLEGIWIILSIVMVMIAWSYQGVLLSWLYLGYLEGKEHAYFPSLFFDFSRMKRFFGASRWVMLLFPLGLVLFVVYGTIVTLSYGGPSEVFSKMNQQGFDLYSILISLGGLAVFLGGVYMIYRLMFIPVIIADTQRYGHLDSGWKILKQSTELTQKTTVWKMVAISVLFGILMTPIRSFNDSDLVASLGSFWAGLIHIVYYVAFGELYLMLVVSMYERIPHHYILKSHPQSIDPSLGVELKEDASSKPETNTKDLIL